MLRPIEKPRPLATPSHRLLVLIIGIAVFGPYVVGGIRTEQLVIYLLLVALVPATFLRFRPQGTLRFLVPWVAYILVGLVAVIFPLSKAAPFGPGGLLAGLDNVLLPLAIMLLIWSVVADFEARELLILVAKVLAWGMAINGLIAMVMIHVDLTSVLRPFWTATDVVQGSTVAERAATLGRFSGIFNQPAEAGYLYGIAGIVAILVYRHRALLLSAILIAITIGGLLSVSKVFILGALPFVILYWLWAFRRRIMVPITAGVALLAILSSPLITAWAGLGYLTRLINPFGDEGVIGFYTAGRIADGSMMMKVIEAAIVFNPFVGVGAGGWRVEYDSVIAEALVTTGIIGLALHLLVLVALFTLPFGLINWHERVFTFFFALITAGAGLGFTPLTANRTATFAWMLIALLVLVKRHDRTHNAWVLGGLKAVDTQIQNSPIDAACQITCVGELSPSRRWLARRRQHAAPAGEALQQAS